MQYNLGKYKYEDYAIHEKRWSFLFFSYWHCIDKGPYPYMMGVKKVNALCGIKDKKQDYSMLRRIVTNNDLSGTYLVNFRRPEGFFGNDPLPATIKPYRGKYEGLEVSWLNGFTSCGDHTMLNVFELKEDD